MSEPKLEDIGDYNTLKGEKKRIVLAVVIAGLIIGTIYVVASKTYGTVDDKIIIEDPIKNVKLK